MKERTGPKDISIEDIISVIDEDDNRIEDLADKVGIARSNINYHITKNKKRFYTALYEKWNEELETKSGWLSHEDMMNMLPIGSIMRKRMDEYNRFRKSKGKNKVVKSGGHRGTVNYFIRPEELDYSEYTDKLNDKGKELFELMNKNSSRTPSGIAAASMYLSTDKTQREIADIFDATTPTIRACRDGIVELLEEQKDKKVKVKNE